MPSGNLQIANATREDEGPYKCAAYNPVTQEVKTSTSTDRLRIRRESSPPTLTLRQNKKICLFSEVEFCNILHILETSLNNLSFWLFCQLFKELSKYGYFNCSDLRLHSLLCTRVAHVSFINPSDLTFYHLISAAHI